MFCLVVVVACYRFLRGRPEAVPSILHEYNQQKHTTQPMHTMCGVCTHFLSSSGWAHTRRNGKRQIDDCTQWRALCRAASSISVMMNDLNHFPSQPVTFHFVFLTFFMLSCVLYSFGFLPIQIALHINTNTRTRRRSTQRAVVVCA